MVALDTADNARARAVWKKTGEIGLLPYDARLRLQKAARAPNPRERIKAMAEADAWVKATYPEYFQPQPKE